jgi:nitrite reductase (NADH) large subunit
MRDIVRIKPDAFLSIYGDEPWEPYDRVKLVSLLSGELAWADLPNLPSLPENHNVTINYSNRIVEIDRKNRTVTDSNGRQQGYSKLILATGSRPWIPDIPGIDLPGVHAFRNVSDVHSLLEKGYAGRRVAVLGGGLLGVELACGLRKKGEQTCIVVSGRLLGQQLDDRAGELLLQHLKSLGIEVIFGRASEILGAPNKEGEVTAHAVQTFCKQKIDCDCVVLATGIIPVTDLALSSKLATGRGIKVNDYLQTADPLIYAAGECAEHRGRVYGLVGPGFEQADVVAQNTLGGKAKYHGSAIAAQLKGADIAAFSCAREDLETQLESRSISYESKDHTQYRALHLNNGYLTGVVCIGEWPEAWRVREAVLEGRRLTPWEARSFLASGSPWPEGSGISVTDWPQHATVCNCMGITRGLLTLAMEQGHCDVNALKMQTTAGTGCGSCLPFLAELVGQPNSSPSVEGASKLTKTSITALLLLLLFVFMPALPPPDTLQDGWHIADLWLKNEWKQLSGYSLLVLSGITLLMSLRKRWRFFSYLSYPGWRVIHATVGMLGVFILMLHTGLALGHNLDRILLANFLLLTLFGAITSYLVVIEGSSTNTVVRRLKSLGYWGHVLLFWPLPVLLAFHIFSTYYF